jgi:hypothetical protein
MTYLNFISDENLVLAVKKVIGIIEYAEKYSEEKLFSNVIDPFSALFDGITHNIQYENWIEVEKIRQVQKTMQNAIGDFHQDILGNVYGCENLGLGGGLDLINNELKIIAEIKNKFNTTKGNHKVEIYDAIAAKLKENIYRGYTGYYVEIIPNGKKEYNKAFTPSDNKTKMRRPEIEFIRVIDGKSFYQLLTGEKYALQNLFEILPTVISDHYEYRFDKDAAKKYVALFRLAFNTEK